MATAAILTIGNELVSGDVPNTNGSWLAKRLAPLGVETRLLAAVPDEIEPIAELIRREAPRFDFFLVTGGLGGTPDDLTREALAYAFDTPQEEMSSSSPRIFVRASRAIRSMPPARRPYPAAPPDLESARWRPGFTIETSTCAGLPSEIEAMFDSIGEKIRRGRPIGAWRRTYGTRESVIAPALVEAGERWTSVLVGSSRRSVRTGPPWRSS